MIIGVILAAGKGSRFKSDGKNKTSVDFLGKPLVRYGAELYQSLTNKIVVVTGAYEESVKEALSGMDITYVMQKDRLGTGHATEVAVDKLIEDNQDAEYVFVGYGDHMMTYTEKNLHDMLSQVKSTNAAMSLVAAEYDKPNELAWGRIVRDKNGAVTKIVEQKDATDKEKEVTFLNAGFYCFKYDFLKQGIKELTKSEATGEYYLTEMVSIAINKRLKVDAYTIPFSEVGVGINTREQLEQAIQASV